MAYNKRNFYERVLAIHEEYLELKKQDPDITNQEVYWKLKPKYHFSKRTFDEYLGINARRKLRELEEEEKLKNQIKLF